MHENLRDDTKKDTVAYTANERHSCTFTDPQSLNFRRIMRKSKDDIIKDMNTKTHGQKAKNMYIDVLLEKKEEDSRNKLLDDIKQYRSSILQLIGKLREKVKLRKEREEITLLQKAFRIMKDFYILKKIFDFKSFFQT